MFDFMCETGGNEIWTPVSVASNWLKVVSRPPRLPEDNASYWMKVVYSIGRGRCSFRLAIPLSGQLLWGSRCTPYNEFQG